MITRFLNILILTTLFNNIVTAQRWSLIKKSEIEEKSTIDIKPEVFFTFDLDDELLRTKLWSAPQEQNVNVQKSNIIIEVPVAQNKMDYFKIVQYDMMEPELAAKFSEIKTFHGVSVSDPLRSIRMDYTLQGFRAVIRDADNQIFIDHYQRNDPKTRILYNKRDYKKTPKWGCDFAHDHNRLHDENHQRSILTGDCKLRSYRLAQATTGEYSTFHGGTPTSVMSAVVNVINRINQVYEAEVGVRLILVNNTDTLFFYNANTDPYTNNNGNTMLGQNITTCNNRIGVNNYDIGHVFSTGGGGVAYLRAVCDNSIKAGGVTGSSSPVGDPFTIDYVAHEIGHQFGANHTQNNNCNRNAATAMEPGSASTIMGYAGICSPNVQNLSDAYFHAVSLQEIKTFIGGSTGNACATNIASYVNTAPVVTGQNNYSIPVSTPFILTLAASDPEGHPMTYAWEQMNNNVGTMPPASSNTIGPMFRSIFATTSPSRYFPNLNNVINNSNNTWEVLPSVNRSMTFRGTVRDFTGVAGCNSEIDVEVTTTNAGSGPFAVTSFNTASTWLEGDSKTITWSVANSNLAPVNASHVDILLSYNGGLSFPVVLVSATPNDGSHDIIVPNGLTTAGRIMVRGTNHIFYDLNNANISIVSGSPTFGMDITPGSQIFCIGESKQFVVNISSILGFNSPVTLIASGLPHGMAVSLNTNPVLPGNSAIITVTNNSAPQGSYTLTVTGESGAISKMVTASVQTFDQSVVAPTLSSPIINATEVSVKPDLIWSAVSGALSYDIQISLNNVFTNIVENASSPTADHQSSTWLDGLTEYFWRVRTVSGCGMSSWSGTRSFTTQACFIYTSTNVPLSIPSAAPPVVINSYVQISDRGTITDLDILDLTGTHTWVRDLEFTLFSPSGGNVLFWDRPCNNEDNFNINFDQSAPDGLWPCPPTNGGSYRPSNTLNTFNNNQIDGQWRLQIEDVEDQDGGSLQSWKIKACVNNFCRLTVDNDKATGVGSLYTALNCASTGDTIRFRSNLNNMNIHLGNLNIINNKTLVIEADPASNIHLISTGTNATIINNSSLTIKGLHIHAPNNNTAAVENYKNMHFENVTLHNYPGGNNLFTLLNSGSLTVAGNCRILND